MSEAIVSAQILDAEESLCNLERDRSELQQALNILEKHNRAVAKFLKLFRLSPLNRKILRQANDIKKLKSGKTGVSTLLYKPCYAIKEILRGTTLMVSLHELCKKLHLQHGSEGADVLAHHLIAKMIMLLLFLPLLIIGFLAYWSTLMSIPSFLFIIFGVFSAFLVVLPYVDAQRRCDTRIIRLKKQLPDVSNSLSLLVASNIPINQAWELVAESSPKELYSEMLKTHSQLEGMVDVNEAYRDFSTRCNNLEEVRELSLTMVQARFFTPVELQHRLKNLCESILNKHLHQVRAQGENIKSKLIIPAILFLFVVLAMIAVPVFMELTQQVSHRGVF